MAFRGGRLREQAGATILDGVDLDVAVPADGFAAVEFEFKVSFVGGSGTVLRRSLADCATFGFEQVKPVRGFRWSRSERHFPGWYWAATTGSHIGYESWLERDRLILLDFDHEISGISSQPFCPGAGEKQVADCATGLLQRVRHGPQGRADQKIAARTLAARPLSRAIPDDPDSDDPEPLEQDFEEPVVPLALFDPLRDPWTRT